MANWKKVIVSGSSAELLAVTASFFKGDGSALTGVVASSANALTAGSGLSAAGTYDGGVARTFTVDSGSMLSFYTSSTFNQVSGDISITAGGVSAIGSGKVTSAMIVDGTITGTDIAAATVANSNLVNSAITIGTTSTSLGASNTTIVGLVSVTSTGFTGALTGNASTATALATARTIGGVSFDGTANINLPGVNSTGNQNTSGNATTATTLATARNINGTSFNGSADITVTAAATTLTGATLASNVLASSLTSVGTLAGVTVTGTAALATATVSNNLTVSGDLFVNGTTTSINTSNLFVSDKFITIASGSVTATDGGIIVDRGSDAAGNIAYAYDSTTNRWGFQNGLNDTTATIAHTNTGDSAFVGLVFTEGAHGATKPTTGEFAVAGTIYVNTDGTIFIYG